jgi:hypothetical protein
MLAKQPKFHRQEVGTVPALSLRGAAAETFPPQVRVAPFHFVLGVSRDAARRR